MDKILAKWDKQSEWIRWILCWPIIILSSWIVGFFSPHWFGSILGLEELYGENGQLASVGALLVLALSQALYFTCMYACVAAFVPRGQGIVATALGFLFALLGIVVVVGAVIAYRQQEYGIWAAAGLIILGCQTVGTAIFGAYTVTKAVKRA